MPPMYIIPMMSYPTIWISRQKLFPGEQGSSALVCWKPTCRPRRLLHFAVKTHCDRIDETQCRGIIAKLHIGDSNHNQNHFLPWNCSKMPFLLTFHDPVPVPRADGEPLWAVEAGRVLEGALVGGASVDDREGGRQGRRHHDHHVLQEHRVVAVHHAVTCYDLWFLTLTYASWL